MLESGTDTTLVMLEGISITYESEEYFIKSPRQINISVADPKQVIAVNRLWTNVTDVREVVDGDTAFWMDSLDATSQFQCSGQCSSRSLYSVGSSSARHSLGRMGGYDINLAEFGPSSGLVNNLNATLILDTDEERTLSITNSSIASDDKWSLRAIW